MDWPKRVPALLVVAALLAATPLSAWAEGDDQMADSAPDPMPGVSVSCAVQTLPVRASELTPGRITCEVTGAPATDTAFTLRITGADDAAGTPQTVCVGSLSNGAGTCMGLVRDSASIIQGWLALTARLEPSGTVVSVPPPLPPLVPASTPL